MKRFCQLLLVSFALTLLGGCGSIPSAGTPPDGKLDAKKGQAPPLPPPPPLPGK